MSGVFRDPNAGWAAVLVLVLPLVIIGAGELEERLRQRDSPLRRSVTIVRTWVVPLFALWALAQVLVDPEERNPAMRLVSSALVLALSVAVLTGLRVLVVAFRDRPRREGRRAVPRLVLAVPRLVVVLVTAWVLVSSIWAVDLSAALTALGVTSLIVSFALQDTLGGLASGFTLLADQPFQPGDWIRVDGTEGRVIDINWRSSRIQTRDGSLVIIPNGVLAKATIVNYDEPTHVHRVVVSLQVAFSNPPNRATDMLLAAARATPGVLAEPRPEVRIVSIDDPLMGYDVHLWIDDFARVPEVRSAFGSLVWYHSHRMGVPLPSPAQDLYLWDGQRVQDAARRDRGSVLGGLASSPLLSQLPAEELDRLADATEAVRFSAGERICSTGDDALLVVEGGQSRLVVEAGAGDPVPVLSFEPGDVVDLAALDAGDLGRARVVAVSDCDVLLVSADVASGVIARSPDLGAALEQLATSRRTRTLRAARRMASRTDGDAS